MADILKWAMTTIVYGIFWVFVLSAKSGEVRLFDKVSAAVVNNSVVTALDRELSDVFSRLYQTASITLNGRKDQAKKRVEEL